VVILLIIIIIIINNNDSRRWTWYLPPLSLRLHSFSNLDEAGDVGTSDQGRELALGRGDVFLGGGEAVLEAVLHDILKLAVDLFGCPGDALAVLRHLKTGDCDAASVGCLTRSVPDSISLLVLADLLEGINGLLCTTHVGALSNELAASLDKSLSLITGHLVLGRRRERNINLLDERPWAGTLVILEGVLEAGGGSNLAQLLTVELELGDLLDVLGGNALLAGGDEGAFGIGERENGATEFDDLEGSVLGDVAGAGDDDPLALEGLLAAGCVVDHVVDVVDQTVTRGLWPDEGTTPCKTLTSEDTLPFVPVLLVCTEHVTNLTATNTDITSRDISVSTDMPAQFAHKGVAELADLVVRLALGVEVGTTLTTAHVKAGKSILKDLLEAEELEDGEVDGRMEAETALVGAQCAVELHTETTVYLELAFVVFPGYAELDQALRDGGDLEGTLVVRLLLEEGGVLEGGGKLLVGLLELGLARKVRHID